MPEARLVIDDAAAERFAAHWSDRLGAGDGLTPYADDVACGALVALSAAAHPLSAGLAREVADAPLEELTTATSAALLRYAARGYCIDQLADYVEAVGGPAADERDAASALAAVGSSSGRGLAEGVRAVLAPACAEAAA